MAMINCKECNNQVSSKAKACPHCGVAISQPTSMGTWLVLLLFMYALFGISQCSPSKPPTDAANKAAPQKTPEEIANEAKAEKRFKLTTAAALTLKKSLNDPDSLRWKSISANDDASVVCLDYRAKNVLGGVNSSYVTFVNLVPSKSEKTWNKYCTKPDILNMNYVKYAVDKIN